MPVIVKQVTGTLCGAAVGIVLSLMTPALYAEVNRSMHASTLLPHPLSALTPIGPDKVGVLKNGAEVLVQSAFSTKQDVVIQVGKGINKQINFKQTRLVPHSADLTEADFKKGVLIHSCGDDSTPWNLNSTYIGANHGCSNAREITCKNHGRTTADIGHAWQDGAGTKFYIIRIVNADKFWLLSENKSTNNIWRFTTHIAGTTLTDQARGLILTFTNTAMAQLTPACRINKQTYLADGRTPIEDGQFIICRFFDIVEEYDIINPAALLADIIRHPGVEPNFTADHLAAVIRNQIVYRFYPQGCTVVEHRSKALQDFRLGYMGFIQSLKLSRGAFATHEYYIPKTKAFTQDGIAYNFKAIQDYTFKLPTPLHFTAASSNIEYPDNLPERFIQFLGNKADGKTVRRVGYALGYSLTQGMTQPAERAKNILNAIMLYTSSKSYPSAADGKMGNPILAGTEFHCVAYRQYFNPAAQTKATCVYWHPEGTGMVVYVDYHQDVSHDRVKLPKEMTNKQITVIEKTDSLTLHTDTMIPAEGIDLSVANGYGYLVFSVK